MTRNEIAQHAIGLLQALISIPSYSREEAKTATYLEQYLHKNEIDNIRINNNIIAKNKHFDANKPSIVLNSHHDTVPTNGGYTKHPFHPEIVQDKLYGLGSNDAGGCLVSLLACFQHYYKEQLPYNLIFIASAEEEVSGIHGVRCIYQSERLLQYVQQDYIDPTKWCGIIGEPTQMQMAIAEKGLLVVDAIAHGISGHAARQEGKNALYIAIEDIISLRNITFNKESTLLGKTQLSVTVMNTDNQQHNVIPERCHFIIDVRYNECYTPDEVLTLLQKETKSDLTARSSHLKATTIHLEHPLVVAGTTLGKKMYGSPTLSDKALSPFPCIKMGPGDSARSHTADEFIYLHEIYSGINDYIELLENCIF